MPQFPSLAALEANFSPWIPGNLHSGGGSYLLPCEIYWSLVPLNGQIAIDLNVLSNALHHLNIEVV